MEKKKTEALTEGALCGEFYVGEGKKVRFSKGNLQFNAVQGTRKASYGGELPGTWRFAEHQWDVIGKDNKKISETYDGFIDLFGWATPGGWLANPWETSKKHKVYYFLDLGYDIEDPEDKENCSLNDDCDWGYNAISNGGDTRGKWRTLTGGEWGYLFLHNRWTMGRIEGMLCFLLIPEGVEVPAKVVSETFDKERLETYVEFDEADYESNSFTEEQFKKYEELGVVALPCGGYRTGKTVKDVGSIGIYWSSAICDMEVAYSFIFGPVPGNDGKCFVNSVEAGNYLFEGCSVRLVQDI